jgi:S1-C subfamily serine protease
VIVAADGQQLTDESSLAQILSQHKPGDTISLTVIRSGRWINVQVTLGQAPTP